MATENEQKRLAIILAGGLGKRMNSSIPKVLNVICGKPMIVHLLAEALNVCDHIFIVVGKYEHEIKQCIEYNFMAKECAKIEYVMQMYPLGTGHAVKCVRPYIIPWLYTYINSRCLVLSGDVPFISGETMESMFSVNSPDNTKLIVGEMECPFGYGRIISHLDENGDEMFDRIVEEKDATIDEKMVNIVNCGIYSFNAQHLFNNIDKLTNKNQQREYYLTDMVEILAKEKYPVELFHISNDKIHEVMGINDMKQLLELEKMYSEYTIKPLPTYIP